MRTKIEKAQITEYLSGPSGLRKVVAWAAVGHGCRSEISRPVDPDGGRLLSETRQVTYGPDQSFEASGHSIFSVEPGREPLSLSDQTELVELTEII